MLCGPFTTAQKQKVLSKLDVNISWVTEAFQWLRQNNRLYEHLPTPLFCKLLVIDHSREEESGDGDTEKKENISVVFPDGTVNTGGLEDGRNFEETLAELRAAAPHVPPYLVSQPSKHPLRDHEDDNLMKAFPLQFPYGWGLPQSFIREKTSVVATLELLLCLSIRSFHESCFVLVVHNMFERGRALNGAIWRVMGKHETCTLLVWHFRG